MDGPTSQNVMPVDGEGLPGKALKYLRQQMKMIWT